jgi:hypothetical protein
MRRQAALAVMLVGVNHLDNCIYMVNGCLILGPNIGQT